MQRLILALAIVVVAPVIALGQCACPECGSKVAVGLLKKNKDKVKVYSVEREQIAVPNICLPKPLFRLRHQIANLLAKKCFPGSPCGACEIEDCPKQVRQGKIRHIKVLKKENVQCASCGYKWEVTDVQKVDEYLYGKPKSPKKPEAPPLEPKSESTGESNNTNKPAEPSMGLETPANQPKTGDATFVPPILRIDSGRGGR